MPVKLLSLPILLFAMTTTLAIDLDYYRDVHPFLKSNCISCHNETTTKADLDMETPELMIKSGAVNLSPAEIAILKQ